MITSNNCYVTLEEAQEIISSSFTSVDPMFETWNNLSSSDQEVLLINSTRAIDNLRLSGGKLNYGQTLQFPRRTMSFPGGIGYRLWVSQYYDNSIYPASGSSGGGLYEAQLACCINAVYGASLAKATNSAVSNRIQGLTSKKAGPIAESYDSNPKTQNLALQGIYTEQVLAILRPWLSDGRYST